MQTKLTMENIIDGKKPWFDVLDCDLKDPQPCHLRRVNKFISQANPENIKSKSIDLATLLIILRHRNCFIEIPEYENTKQQKIKTNQYDIGGDRRGRIICLKSNQHTFNFSITIENEKYIELRKNGKIENFCPRTYTLTNSSGDLMDNWKNFKFEITDKEREFLSNIIEIDGSINCDRFCNLQLASSYYTEYYRLMKCLILRLVAERKYLNELRKKHLSFLPFEHKDTDESNVVMENKDKYESVKELCFESKISNFDPTFEFNYIDESKLSHKDIVNLCDEYLRELLNITDEYKFMCRLIELAYTKINPYKENMNPAEFPIYNRNNCKWNEQTVKLPKGRIVWFELMFKEYSILSRYYMKSIQRKIKE